MTLTATAIAALVCAACAPAPDADPGFRFEDVTATHLPETATAISTGWSRRNGG